MRSDLHRQVIDQFKARLPIAPVEMIWATGNAVPIGFKPPPDWVKKAIQRMVDELGLLRGTTDGKATPHLVGKYYGLVTTAIAAATYPSEEEKLDEAANPALKELRELLGAWLAAIVPVFEEATAKEQSLAAPKTANDYKESYAGAIDGAAFVADEDAGEMTMMGELSFWMWLFWPQVEGMKNRVEAFAWVGDMKFVSCSFKLFEKLCQEIGYSPDRRT
jgi:hypothetical protein